MWESEDSVALGWTCGGNQKTYLWNPIWVALLNEMSSTGVEIHVDGRYSRISKSDSACTTVYWGVSIVFSAARTPTAATRAKANTNKHALEAIFTRNLQNLPAHTPNQPNSCYQHIDIITSTTCQPQSITPKLSGHISRNRVYKAKKKREICNRKIIATTANWNPFRSSRFTKRMFLAPSMSHIKWVHRALPWNWCYGSSNLDNYVENVIQKLVFNKDNAWGERRNVGVLIVSPTANPLLETLRRRVRGAGM